MEFILCYEKEKSLNFGWSDLQGGNRTTGDSLYPSSESKFSPHSSASVGLAHEIKATLNRSAVTVVVS